MIASFFLLCWHDARGGDRAKNFEQGLIGRYRRIAADGNTLFLARDHVPILSVGPAVRIIGWLHGLYTLPDDLGGRDALRALINNCWGNYLAHAQDKNGGTVMVDPSGAGRAHLARDASLALVTDALEPKLMRAAGFDVQVDTAALAGCIVDPGTMVSAPLLGGVTAMVPGTAYSLGAGGERTVLWSPATLACNDGACDAQARGAALRAGIDTAVSATARRRSHLLELSGGLDSSIVAGTLSDLGIDVRAVTVEVIGGDVDELRYAKATASRNRIPLHVAKAAAYPDYRAFMEHPQVAHPYMYGVDDAFAAAVREASDGAASVVTGQGVDAVFFQPATPLTSVIAFMRSACDPVGTPCSMTPAERAPRSGIISCRSRRIGSHHRVCPRMNSRCTCLERMHVPTARTTFTPGLRPLRTCRPAASSRS